MRLNPLIKESFLATVLTVAIAFLIFILPSNLKVFDPLKKTFKKIDLLDIYYSQIRSGKSGFGNQQDVVLLNIAKLNRTQIGNVLEVVNTYNPGVIALDLSFMHTTADSIDAPLKNQLEQIGDKLVIANKIINGQQIGLHPYFGSFTEGYSNLISEGNPQYSPIRKVQLKDAESASLAYRIMQKYDPDKLHKLEKNHQLEYPQLINYYGYHNRFLHFEHTEITRDNPNLDILKDKIILVGDFGKTFDDHKDVDDRFHTPMNAFGPGMGFPDMKGALIHANVVQMLIDESLIIKISEGLNWTISILFTFIIVVLFSFSFVKRHLWFHIIAKGVQIGLALLFMLLCIWLYVYAQIKFDPKYLLLLVILSVDALYFYEAIVTVLHNKYHIKSYFIHEHH